MGNLIGLSLDAAEPIGRDQPEFADFVLKSELGAAVVE